VFPPLFFSSDARLDAAPLFIFFAFLFFFVNHGEALEEFLLFRGGGGAFFFPTVVLQEEGVLIDGDKPFFSWSSFAAFRCWTMARVSHDDAGAPWVWFVLSFAMFFMQCSDC